MQHGGGAAATLALPGGNYTALQPYGHRIPSILVAAQK